MLPPSVKGPSRGVGRGLTEALVHPQLLRGYRTWPPGLSRCFGMQGEIVSSQEINDSSQASL